MRVRASSLLREGTNWLTTRHVGRTFGFHALLAFLFAAAGLDAARGFEALRDALYVLQEKQLLVNDSHFKDGR